MKNIISAALIFAILMIFTSCNNLKDNTPPSQAKIYYDYLTSLGEIKTESADSPKGRITTYNVNDLYYFAEDFNYDGIIDLAISAEPSDSNGIEIYTYKDGQVTPLLSKRMPYSAGIEIFTIAKCDDTYGIKHLRQNSVGEFSFIKINKNGTLNIVFEGISYDPQSNPLEDAAYYDKITPVNFYKIDQLNKM